MDLKIRISKKWALISSLTVVLSVLVDFFSKKLVMDNMALGESIPLIKNVLHLTYILNSGAAFGSLSGQRWIFMSMSVVMIAVIGALILTWDDRKPLFYISASLILGGGVGNMIDRIFYGEVVDFIDFCAFPELWKWIFNFADSFVCIGVGLLVIYFIRAEIRNAKLEKERKAAEGQTDVGEVTDGGAEVAGAKDDGEDRDGER